MDLNVLAGMQRRRSTTRRAACSRADADAQAAAQDRARGHGPQDQEGRQADRRRPARHRAGHRLRAAAGLPPDLCRRQPKAKIGLPEIMVGLFPGAGGTTRLVRKLGAMAAAPYLLEGKTLAPAKAQGRGADRRGRAPDDLLASAKAWVLNATRRRPGQTLGREGLQDARRRALSPGRLHDLRRRRGDGARQDQGRLPGGQGAAVGGLRRRAGALRHGARRSRRAGSPRSC